jgi:hypothetical protein
MRAGYSEVASRAASAIALRAMMTRPAVTATARKHDQDQGDGGQLDGGVACLAVAGHADVLVVKRSRGAWGGVLITLPRELYYIFTPGRNLPPQTPGTDGGGGGDLIAW